MPSRPEVGCGLCIAHETVCRLSAIARNYSHADVPTDFAIETDSSLSFADCPYEGVRIASLEVKTRILNGVTDFGGVVPKALELMSWIGCRVNQTTGLHVHISIPEIRDEPRVIRSVYNLIHKYQYVLFGLCPQSRLTSRYCQPLSTAPALLKGCRTMRCFKQALSSLDRHHLVNFEHLFGSDTPRIEFRLFASTLNKTKALNSVRLVCGLVDHAVRRSVQAVSEPLTNDRRALCRRHYAALSPETLAASVEFRVPSPISSAS